MPRDRGPNVHSPWNCPGVAVTEIATMHDEEVRRSGGRRGSIRLDDRWPSGRVGIGTEVARRYQAAAEPGDEVTARWRRPEWPEIVLAGLWLLYIGLGAAGIRLG